MAVSEKKIKTLISSEKAKISPEKFFTSPVLAAYFNEIIRLIYRRKQLMTGTRSYSKEKNPTVKIVWDVKHADEGVAATNHQIIGVNAASTFITKNVSSLEEHLEMVKGLVAHELGHILFTDNDAKETYYSCLELGRWWPEEPSKVSVLSDIEDYISEKKNRMKLISVVHSGIWNAIEDGYIEDRYMAKYPGNLAQSLYLVREKQCYSAMTIEQMDYRTKLDESNPEYMPMFCALSALMLQYAKYGVFITENDDTAYDTDLVKTFSKVMPYIDNFLGTADQHIHFINVNNIIVEFWSYLKEYLDMVPDDQPEDGTPSELDKALGDMSSSAGSIKGDGAGSGSADCDNSDPSEDGKSERSKNAEKTSKKTKASGKDDDSSDGASGSSAATEESGEDKSETGSSVTLDVSADSDGEHAGTEESVCADADSVGGSVFNGDYEGSGYDSADSDIERLLEKIAEEEAMATLEKEHTDSIRSFASSIDKGANHSGITYYIERMNTVPESYIERYNKVAGPLLEISKAAQRKYLQKIKDQAIGGKMTGLYYGKKLNTPAIMHNDCRWFYKNKLPTEQAQLAVCVLVDESGSMCSSDRATYARSTAIILQDFCAGLNIPCAIYGHSSDQKGARGTDVEMYAYCDFDKVDGKDKYRLMDISARANNRDGAALKFCGDLIKKRPEQKKLLIVISDGQPCSSGYSGKSAEQDMTNIKKAITREGTTVFAAAIGEDKENIQRIYGDGFLDITNLKSLPTILINLISRYLRF